MERYILIKEKDLDSWIKYIDRFPLYPEDREELQSLKQKGEVVETMELKEEDWYNKREMFTKFFKGNYKLIKKV